MSTPLKDDSGKVNGDCRISDYNENINHKDQHRAEDVPRNYYGTYAVSVCALMGHLAVFVLITISVCVPSWAASLFSCLSV